MFCKTIATKAFLLYNKNRYNVEVCGAHNAKGVLALQFKRKHKVKHSLGLALSGGGTRGFAHVGVFRALQEAEISVQYVAGTSAGSIFGALFCAEMPWEQMLEKAKTFSRKDVLEKRWLLGSDAMNIAQIVRRFVGNVNIEQLKIPFAAVAVDLELGEEVVFTKGEVATAVSASSAVPLLFKPVQTDGKILVDGGLLNNMPADVCRKMGAEVVVGVDLNYARGKGTTSTKMWDTAVATWNITTKNAMLKGQINSDVIITPELNEFKNTRLEHIEEMAEAGYLATKDKIPQILELLNTKF